MNKFVFAFIAFLYLQNSFAQELREEATMNLGSSIAYIGLCERENYIAAYTSQIMLSANKSLGKDTFERLRKQYQKSLHEKKQYSISKNKWIPFNVNRESCKDLEKSIPMLLNHFDQIAKQYPKN